MTLTQQLFLTIRCFYGNSEWKYYRINIKLALCEIVTIVPRDFWGRFGLVRGRRASAAESTWSIILPPWLEAANESAIVLTQNWFTWQLYLTTALFGFMPHVTKTFTWVSLTAFRLFRTPAALGPVTPLFRLPPLALLGPVSPSLPYPKPGTVSDRVGIPLPVPMAPMEGMEVLDEFLRTPPSPALSHASPLLKVRN